MSAPVVEAVGLTKRYGSSRGVEQLDFALAPGEVLGFLGANGAGKSTTIRLLLDLIRPTAGRVAIFGRDPRGDSGLRARIGYVPGDLRLFPRLTGRQTLRYLARLRGLDGLGDAEPLARRLDLDLDRRAQELSKGNRQKLGLVQAFMHRPDLLVLDEPTAGLDPLGQQAFDALVREARDEGRTFFLSSHLLPEVQHVADRVALIRDGRLALVGGVDELRAHARTRIEVAFAEPPPPDAFADVPGVEELERRGSTVVFALHDEADALVKALARYTVVTVDSHAPDLEDVFLALYGHA